MAYETKTCGRQQFHVHATCWVVVIWHALGVVTVGQLTRFRNAAPCAGSVLRVLETMQTSRQCVPPSNSWVNGSAGHSIVRYKVKFILVRGLSSASWEHSVWQSVVISSESDWNKARLSKDVVSHLPRTPCLLSTSSHIGSRPFACRKPGVCH